MEGANLSEAAILAGANLETAILTAAGLAIELHLSEADQIEMELCDAILHQTRGNVLTNLPPGYVLDDEEFVVRLKS